MGRERTTHQSLYEPDGRRKYLSDAERDRFIEVARCWPRVEVGSLALVLAFGGCRISEALSLRRNAFDTGSGSVAIRSLKKRGVMVVREVPLPHWVVSRVTSGDASDRLFTLSRSRAWQLIKEIMRAADIEDGPHCTPKGLRHGFGVHAIRASVPLHLIQRWLGHASLSTTAIYLNVVGEEEREFAARMWTEHTTTTSGHPLPDR